MSKLSHCSVKMSRSNSTSREFPDSSIVNKHGRGVPNQRKVRITLSGKFYRLKIHSLWSETPEDFNWDPGAKSARAMRNSSKSFLGSNIQKHLTQFIVVVFYTCCFVASCMKRFPQEAFKRSTSVGTLLQRASQKDLYTNSCVLFFWHLV